MPDLDAFIERINHAESVAPILDPTLWMRGSKRLDAIKDLASECRGFQLAARRFRVRFSEIEAREALRR